MTDHWIIAPATATAPLFMHCAGDDGDATAVAITIAAVEARVCEVHTISAGKLTNVTRHHPSGARERLAIFRDGGLISGIVL